MSEIRTPSALIQSIFLNDDLPDSDIDANQTIQSSNRVEKNIKKKFEKPKLNVDKSDLKSNISPEFFEPIENLVISSLFSDEEELQHLSQLRDVKVKESLQNIVQKSIKKKMTKSFRFTQQQVADEIQIDEHEFKRLSFQGITNEVKTYSQLNQMIQAQKEQEPRTSVTNVKNFQNLNKEEIRVVLRDQTTETATNEPYDISPSELFIKNLEQDAKEPNWLEEKIKSEGQKFLGKYFEKKKEMKSQLQFEGVQFECEHCKSFGGQFQFETRLVYIKEYVFVIKGFDHISNCLILLIYRYDVNKCTTSFVEKIILCKSLHEECVSVFYASYSQVGNWLYYWKIVEETDQNIFEFRKLDIQEMEEHILVKQIKCPRENIKYHTIGLIANKQFMQFIEHSCIDVQFIPKEQNYNDYYLSLFYSNDQSKYEVKLEIRKYEFFQNISFECILPINLKDTIFSTYFKKSLFQTFIKFDTCPERMIVLHCRDFNYSMHYHLFEINENDSIQKIDIPTDEESQIILKTQFRDITSQLRKEIIYFNNYKFQWYYEFHMQRKEGKNVPIQFKCKTKAVFTSVNNIARDFLSISQDDVKHQKLNLIYDMNENKILMLLMKTSKELCIFEIDTQIGNRTQIFQERQMSNFNFQIMQILKHETQLNVNLTYSQNFKNLIRNHKLIYCFRNDKCIKISDINHKCSQYHKNFLYQIDQNWYLQFSRAGIKTFFTPDQAPQNMYCNITDDLGTINSTLFIQYNDENQLDEYVLEWNPKYTLDTEHLDHHQLPIQVGKSKKWKIIRNPLQVKMEQIRIQENPIICSPFVGILYQASNSQKVDSLWFGILDIEIKQVTHCHQVDINREEIKFIQSIQFSKSSMLDGELDYKNVNSMHKLIVGCSKEYSYQVMVWFGDDIWVLKIYEYRVRWWNEPQQNNQGYSNITVEQTSQKVIVGAMDPKEDLRVSQMQFFSLFDNKMNIIGTVLDAKMLQNEDKMKVINLENFKQADYQFQNKFCYFGYKTYNMNYLQTQKFLVVEAKLKEKILDTGSFFSDYDKNIILSNQNTATLNHVPFRFQSFIHLDGKIEQTNFNFFKPLQILDGASECTYQLYHPSTVGNKLNIQKAKENKKYTQDMWFYQSLLDVILNDGNGKQKEILQKFGYTTFMIPDLKNQLTSLHYCFAMTTIQMQSAHILIQEILNTPVQSEFNQLLMTQILSNILDRKKMSHQLYNFFIKENNQSELSSRISFEKFYDHDLLPRGSEKERQVFNFDPVHISTQCLENTMFDIIMQNESQIEGQIYSIEYSYIDLRPMNFQRKIDQVINQKDEKDLIFKPISYLDFQILSDSIAWGSEEKFEQMGGLQKVIDKIFFDQTRGYFFVLNFVYNIGFVAPFMCAEFGILGDNTAILMNIASITMGLFTLIEIIELIENRWAYFMSFWNRFDMSLILGWYALYFLRLSKGFQEDKKIYLKDEYTDWMVKMNVLKVIVISLGFMKIINFCRVFEGFASLIMLLDVVLSDLKYFQLFFFLLIALFTFLQQILSMQYQGYQDVPQGTILFIQSFQNSIGNISTPEYPLLTNLLENNPFLAGIQLILIWFIWFANQYIILVIMLNFLISIIGESYAKVTSRSIMHAYRFRNELNVEYLQIRGKFKEPMKLSCILLVTSVHDYQNSEDNTDKFKQQIIEVSGETTRKEVKEALKQIQNMDGRLLRIEKMIEGISESLGSQSKQ